MKSSELLKELYNTLNKNKDKYVSELNEIYTNHNSCEKFECKSNKNSEISIIDCFIENGLCILIDNYREFEIYSIKEALKIIKNN